MTEVTYNPQEFLWVTKYRPKTISECILPDELKDTFQSISEGDRIPSLLLSGGAGIGKTTVAKALCDQVGVDWLLINGSEENGIDVLRTKIRSFASTMSLEEKKKVVIIDEADYLNANSIQPALRGFAEEFSSNCTFILTCNFKNRIIEPLQSRFTPVEFKIKTADKPKLASQFMKRAETILQLEGVEYDKKVVAELISKHFPDFRRILNELQRYSVSGKIDTGILVNLSDDNFNQLIQSLKSKSFNSCRKWVANNLDIDTVKLFSDFYNKASEKMVPSSIPELVLILSEYQYKAAFVANQEINTMAALTEIMSRCEWT